MRTSSMKQTYTVKNKILCLRSYALPVALAGFGICAQTAALNRPLRRATFRKWKMFTRTSRF